MKGKQRKREFCRGFVNRLGQFIQILLNFLSDGGCGALTCVVEDVKQYSLDLNKKIKFYQEFLLSLLDI